jgi:hypothetical protein
MQIDQGKVVTYRANGERVVLVRGRLTSSTGSPGTRRTGIAPPPD